MNTILLASPIDVCSLLAQSRKEIELADLKETTDDTKLAFVQQQKIVSTASEIVGKRAKDNIAMGEMLFEDNFQ